MENEELIPTANDIIEAYKLMALDDKRKALGEDILELAAVIRKLLNDTVGPVPEINTDEYLNLFDPRLSEEEYLDGLYEDFFNLKELIAIYLKRSTEELYADEEEISE